MELQDGVNIARWEDANLGSFCRLLLVKRKYVTVLTYRRDDYQVRVRNLVLALGSAFVSIDFHRPQDSLHTESPQASQSGLVYAQNIRLTVRRDRIQLTRWLMDWANSEVLAVLTDFNGNIKLVGELERPLVLRASFNRGENINATQAYTFELTGLTKHLSAWHESSETPVPTVCTAPLPDGFYYVTTADGSRGIAVFNGAEYCWISKVE